MIDFNHRNPSEAINAMIDAALVANKMAEPPRTYLGGSTLGHECERQLQFQYLNVTRDTPLAPKSCKAFELGHALEEIIARWLKLAGFHLIQVEEFGPRLGLQFEAVVTFPGFETPPIKMHRDGIIIGGPPILTYPCLWECKTMAAKYWKKCADNGVFAEFPDYYGQVQTYQKVYDLTANPALFTAFNKDTSELYHERIDHAPARASALIERGERVVKACKRGVLLPRISNSPSHFKCKPAWCAWSGRCWTLKD